MDEPASYYVYILASSRGVLYVGVTNDLEKRVHAHRSGISKGFSQRYRTSRLVYYEDCADILLALEREKQIKGWRRRRKVELIRRANPRFEDLME